MREVVKLLARLTEAIPPPDPCMHGMSLVLPNADRGCLSVHIAHEVEGKRQFTTITLEDEDLDKDTDTLVAEILACWKAQPE